MNLGAAVGFILDSRERAGVAARLHDHACGFRMTEEGTCLWRFALEPLTAELAAPTGPAVQLSLLFGLPFARLRTVRVVRACTCVGVMTGTQTRPDTRALRLRRCRMSCSRPTTAPLLSAATASAPPA